MKKIVKKTAIYSIVYAIVYFLAFKILKNPDDTYMLIFNTGISTLAYFIFFSSIAFGIERFKKRKQNDRTREIKTRI